MSIKLMLSCVLFSKLILHSSSLDSQLLRPNFQTKLIYKFFFVKLQLFVLGATCYWDTM